MIASTRHGTACVRTEGTKASRVDADGGFPTIKNLATWAPIPPRGPNPGTSEAAPSVVNHDSQPSIALRHVKIHMDDHGAPTQSTLIPLMISFYAHFVGPSCASLTLRIRIDELFLCGRLLGSKWSWNQGRTRVWGLGVVGNDKVVAPHLYTNHIGTPSSVSLTTCLWS